MNFEDKFEKLPINYDNWLYCLIREVYLNIIRIYKKEKAPFKRGFAKTLYQKHMYIFLRKSIINQ